LNDPKWLTFDPNHCKITKFLISEWNANPILITVETTDYPVENITFPTVTVCREDNKPNCFEFVAKMFDYVPFPCVENA
jgi:hypothetical protein